jgi:hypothetical protein
MPDWHTAPGWLRADVCTSDRRSMLASEVIRPAPPTVAVVSTARCPLCALGGPLSGPSDLRF